MSNRYFTEEHEDRFDVWEGILRKAIIPAVPDFLKFLVEPRCFYDFLMKENAAAIIRSNLKRLTISKSSAARKNTSDV